MFRLALGLVSVAAVVGFSLGLAGTAAAGAGRFDGSLEASPFPGSSVLELGEQPGVNGLPLRLTMQVADAPLAEVLRHHVKALGKAGRTVVGHELEGGLAYVAYADDADARLRVLTLVRSEDRTYVFPSDVDGEAILRSVASTRPATVPPEATEALGFTPAAGVRSWSFALPWPPDRAAAALRERLAAQGFALRATRADGERTLLLLEREGASATVVIAAEGQGSRVTLQLTGDADRFLGCGPGPRGGRRDWPKRRERWR